jgi:hypothetical protein
VTVAPGQTIEVPFTVAVPKNATPGDYAGGIVTSLVRPDAAQQINVDRRLGIRIAVRVTGDLTPGLVVEDARITWDGGLNPFAGGDATLTYRLRNTGNAMISAREASTVTGPFGWFPATASKVVPPPQLLPGETWTTSVRFPGAAASFVILGTASVTPTVTDASGSTSDLPPVTATATGPAVPWMLLLLLVVLASLIIAAVRLRVVLLARRAAREDARVQEAVERALAGGRSGRQPSEDSPSA